MGSDSYRIVRVSLVRKNLPDRFDFKASFSCREKMGRKQLWKQMKPAGQEVCFQGNDLFGVEIPAWYQNNGKVKTSMNS